MESTQSEVDGSAVRQRGSAPLRSAPSAATGRDREQARRRDTPHKSLKMAYVLLFLGGTSCWHLLYLRKFKWFLAILLINAFFEEKYEHLDTALWAVQLFALPRLVRSTNQRLEKESRELPEETPQGRGCCTRCCRCCCSTLRIGCEIVTVLLAATVVFGGVFYVVYLRDADDPAAALGKILERLFSKVFPEYLQETESFDPYEVLGVTSSASQQEVRRAYRSAVLRWHPDKNPDCGDECLQKTSEINKAWEILGDVKARRSFDTFGFNPFEGQAPDASEDEPKAK